MATTARRAHGRGEIHFGWVLEGRAIQDVWILPGVFYGTTLRVYDPGLDAWHILWSDPVKQLYTRQIGRARGHDIVQEGVDDAGAAIRWSFTEITPEFVPLARRALARWRRDLAPAGRVLRPPIGGLARSIDSQRMPQQESSMIDHVSIGVRDIARTKRFYDAALKPLGYALPERGRRLPRLWPRGCRVLDQRRRTPGHAG